MQKTFQGDIIGRFFKGKDLKDFQESYREACYRAKVMHKPSAADQRIASHVRTTQSVSRTAKELATTAGRVYGALARVQAYKDND